MPHIHLETTSDLAENAHVPDILAALVECLAKQETVKSSAIKAYHSLRAVWMMGEGAPEGFAHCTVCILTGRSQELRHKMSLDLYNVMVESFAESLGTGLASVTLEIREMERETYRN